MAAGGTIHLLVADPVDIATPSTGHIALFADSTNSNIPSYKDDTGAVFELTGAMGVGSPGPIGPPGIAEENDPEPILIPGRRGPTGATGATGPSGLRRTIIVQQEDAEDGLVGVPGRRGADGTSVGGSGGLVLLGTYTASASATLDIITRNAAGQSGAIFQSDYPVYIMEVVNLLPVTNAVEIRARVSTNGGSSFVSTTSYGHACLRWIAGGSGVAGANSSEAYISIYGGENVDPISNTASAGGLCGTYRIFSPTSSSVKKRITGQTSWLNSAGNNNGATIAAYYDATTAIDAFQFYASSGNLASGFVKVYGLA